MKKEKSPVSGVLDEVKTSFAPKISRETNNAVPAGREHENSENTCTVHSLMNNTFYINVISLQF
jgi:hypothetical protein